MRVWIYGRNEQDICSLLEHCVDNADTIIGFSTQAVTSHFPQSGLAQPMQAAMRGELDRLLSLTLHFLGMRQNRSVR